jgi:hypothetical protein
MASELSLSVIVIIVSGKTALRQCLSALVQQCDPPERHPNDCEIIVPYEKWSAEVGELKREFPRVRFHFYEDLGEAASASIPSHTHRLYDRRRAVGLSIARGGLIAITEDHAVPAGDWLKEIHNAHAANDCAVIGGVIDNQIDRPLNWALYYCDFGRYGSPLRSGASEYISDVNVSYKREALESIREVWREAYHETTVHWTLRSRGEVLLLDPRLTVYQRRPAPRMQKAFRERIEWGRIFAETRVAAITQGRRMMYMVGTPLLPFLMTLRIWRHMRRQRRELRQMALAAPLAFILQIGWAIGELIGYVAGPPREVKSVAMIEARVNKAKG